MGWLNIPSDLQVALKNNLPYQQQIMAVELYMVMFNIVGLVCIVRYVCDLAIPFQLARYHQSIISTIFGSAT